MNPSAHPIGVFDSGIGGLSVLQALRAELPHEDFVYVADIGHAPYGERDAAHVIGRAQALTRQLLGQHHIKALVVACNTATAAAIHVLRQQHAQLPIIGVEPALKPAALTSQTRRIGVMATRSTLGSAKFAQLLQTLQDQADFILQPCDGLADAIDHQDTDRIQALCTRYRQALGDFGAQAGQIDTLVLGCTHYPLVGATLRTLVGPQVTLVDSGAPVARQTRRQLLAHDRLRAPGASASQLCFHTTGDLAQLRQALAHWLQLPAPNISAWH